MLNLNIFFKQIEIGRMGNYAYLIGDQATKQVAVVDPGWDIDIIQNQVQKAGYSITAIIITHGHYDHTGGIDELVKNSCTPVYYSQIDSFLFSTASKIKKDLNDGDIIKIGSVEIKCIHTPGHSPGSFCFLTKNILITGDTLFINGCGRCDLPGSNPETMYDTLKNKILPLPDSLIIYPGHCYSLPSDTLGNQKKTNPYLNFESKEAFLAARL